MTIRDNSFGITDKSKRGFKVNRNLKKNWIENLNPTVMFY
jgi:hypothetical protein